MQLDAPAGVDQVEELSLAVPAPGHHASRHAQPLPAVGARLEIAEALPQHRHRQPVRETGRVGIDPARARRGQLGQAVLADLLLGVARLAHRDAQSTSGAYGGGGWTATPPFLSPSGGLLIPWGGAPPPTPPSFCP